MLSDYGTELIYYEHTIHAQLQITEQLGGNVFELGPTCLFELFFV